MVLGFRSTTIDQKSLGGFVDTNSGIVQLALDLDEIVEMQGSPCNTKEFM